MKKQIVKINELLMHENGIGHLGLIYCGYIHNHTGDTIVLQSTGQVSHTYYIPSFNKKMAAVFSIVIIGVHDDILEYSEII